MLSCRFLFWRLSALAFLAAIAAMLFRPVFAGPVASAESAGDGTDRAFWLDLIDGETAAQATVLADLAQADVVYAGETHSIDRHHAVQLLLLRALDERGVPLVLCLEQIEARRQPAVDRFNRGELDFEGLAREIDWGRTWKNYPDYRALCEYAQARGIPVYALNAPAEVIRAVSRGGGIARLDSAGRGVLPADIVLDDPPYERLMNLLLSVHMAMDPEKLRPVFEAQVARDETMAENIVAARRLPIASGAGKAGQPAGRARTAFVVCGSGHVRFGLGTPDRVRRRSPGIVDRVVLVTRSGQLKLGEAEKAAARPVKISHGDLRALDRPPADYLHVLPWQEKDDRPE
ncbi:hypothetical protein OPIT5_21555 [Opitutaceae bacterium TAV5]|nr:hypothetical protein OPIT5_21555 [Opitutaceae bacterium TAV5]